MYTINVGNFVVKVAHMKIEHICIRNIERTFWYVATISWEAAVGKMLVWGIYLTPMTDMQWSSKLMQQSIHPYRPRKVVCFLKRVILLSLLVQWLALVNATELSLPSRGIMCDIFAALLHQYNIILFFMYASSPKGSTCMSKVCTVCDV